MSSGTKPRAVACVDGVVCVMYVNVYTCVVVHMCGVLCMCGVLYVRCFVCVVCCCNMYPLSC